MNLQPLRRLEVFDPALCCSTGVCGTEVNPDLVNFASLLSQLRSRGVKVERHNLAQQPLAFAQNPAVKGLLEAEGTDALPVILLDGKLYLKGRYPTAEERPPLYRAATDGESQP